MGEDRGKRRKRIQQKRSHYAQSLEHNIFRQRVKPDKKNQYEDFDERRYRKYHDLHEIGLEEDND